MNDYAHPSQLEAEAQLNPYSLLHAVNSSSDTAHTAWLIFIAIMTYLLVSVAGVTHKDLLLSRDIPLPILQVSIDLTRFFLFAPFVLVLFHVGVIAQLVMLARKTLELDNAIRHLEVSERRTHPMRLELHNMFFVQAFAGPERSRIISAFLHGMTWLTLVILPILLLLFIQVAFLPYHDAAITWAHRIALLADMALLISVGVFLMRPEATFRLAMWRTSFQHPIRFAVTAMIMLTVTAFSFLVATVPDEPLDRLARRLLNVDAKRSLQGPDSYSYGLAAPFIGARSDGLLLGLFSRNLIVEDVDLVTDRDLKPDEPTINLRDRNLTYARLDRSDLQQADFSGARLDGASLIGTDLRGAKLGCAFIGGRLLRRDDGRALCPSARGALFLGARMAGARLAGIDLTGANLQKADLSGADLSHAILIGATFFDALLERANMSGGVRAQGANFSTAVMHGADLHGAKLHGANLAYAQLQGAQLELAELHGANLSDTDLEGTKFHRAYLLAANLGGANIRAADFRDAQLWRTGPPESAPLADLSGAISRPIEAGERRELLASIAAIPSTDVRALVQEALAPLLATTGSPDDANRGAWDRLRVGSGSTDTTYRDRLSDALSQLACRGKWNTAGVATGVAKRASLAHFNGLGRRVLVQLRAADCQGAARIAPAVIQELTNAVDREPAR